MIFFRRHANDLLTCTANLLRCDESNHALTPSPSSFDKQNVTAETSFIPNDNVTSTPRTERFSSDVEFKNAIEEKHILGSSPKICKIDPITSNPSLVGIPLQGRKESFSFPKLEKIENSILIINSKIDGFDKLLHVQNTSFEKTKKKDNFISKKCDNPDTDYSNDTNNTKTHYT